MDRRTFFASLAGGLAAVVSFGPSARAAPVLTTPASAGEPANTAPQEMQQWRYEEPPRRRVVRRQERWDVPQRRRVVTSQERWDYNPPRRRFTPRQERWDYVPPRRRVMPQREPWGYGPPRQRFQAGTRPYRGYGPRPVRPAPRCWVNNWGERVCRF